MAVFFESLELLIDEVPHSAPVNMAVDEVLLREISTPLLRFYQWATPAVSFGYFEAFAPIQAAHPGREPVRRWTGGGVVLHGEDLTFSLLVPRNDPFLKLPTSESYRAIHVCLAGILKKAGVGAEVAPVHAPKISQACFENAAQYDLVLQSRKVVGGAQRRTRTGMLHQGSIQALDFIAAVPPSRDRRIVSEAFASELGSAMASKISRRGLLPCELKAAQELANTKYATPAWLEKF